MAEQIPNAKLIEFPSGDHVAWGSDCDPQCDAIEEFLTGMRHTGEPDRMLATVLFTDIVDATATAARLGDRAWRDLLNDHHALVRNELQRFRGRELDTAGDGFLAAFDGPARAARCARAIVGKVRALGIAVRAGVHTGECELMSDGKLGGIAVHIGARVAAMAQPGEVLVSSTVRDLVGGSGLAFEDRGLRSLKGVPQQWHLFAVAD
ncbi:MAG TPA: adenylate/guanylate cyclase domain-containing protein [Burkholderiaceae bacterium]|nr:adenylate/guanylate cyclase domain-containing protein [Burkholderiaceae bacterium]